MRRLLTAALSCILLLSLASTAEAQLGGLKKKVAEKVTGKKDTVATGSTTGKPKCDKSSMVITSDVVDRYLKGLRAQEADQRKIAKEKGPVGEYYAAYFKRQDTEKRKEEFDLRRGKDWERYKVLYPKFVKGDQAAMAGQRALLDSLDPNKVEVPSVDWSAQTGYNRRRDSVALAASGFSECDWGAQGLGERIPFITRALMNDPNTKDFGGYGTVAEGAAVKARLNELADAMGWTGGRGGRVRTDAEQAHIKEEDEKLVRLSMLTGDPYTDCATQVQQDFNKAHQAEMEKASKAQDMAALQRISMLMMQETDKQCKKFKKDSSDDDD